MSMIRVNPQLFVPTSPTENSGSPQVRYLTDGSIKNILVTDAVIEVGYNNGVLSFVIKDSNGNVIATKTL